MNQPLEMFLDASMDRTLNNLLQSGKIDYTAKTALSNAWHLQGYKQVAMRDLTARYGNTIQEVAVQEYLSNFIVAQVDVLRRQQYQQQLYSQQNNIPTSGGYYGGYNGIGNGYAQHNPYAYSQPSMGYGAMSTIDRLYSDRSTGQQQSFQPQVQNPYQTPCVQQQVQVQNQPNNAPAGSTTQVVNTVENVHQDVPVTVDKIDNSEEATRIKKKSTDEIQVHSMDLYKVKEGKALVGTIRVNRPDVEQYDSVDYVLKKLKLNRVTPMFLTVKYPHMHVIPSSVDSSTTALKELKDTLAKDGYIGVIEKANYTSHGFVSSVFKMIVDEINRNVEFRMGMQGVQLPTIETVDDINELLVLNAPQLKVLVEDPRYTGSMIEIVEDAFNKYLGKSSTTSILQLDKHLGDIKLALKNIDLGVKHLSERSDLSLLDENQKNELMKAFSQYSVLTIDETFVYSNLNVNELLRGMVGKTYVPIETHATTYQLLCDLFIASDAVMDILIEDVRSKNKLRITKGQSVFNTVPSLYA